MQCASTYNPHSCLCGYHGDAERQCTCSPAALTRYQKRIVERFRLHNHSQRRAGAGYDVGCFGTVAKCFP